jgi:Tol biopolymer transport system component
VFVRDRQTGTTERISQPLSGAPDGFAMQPSMSADGRFVAFTSQATNLVTKDKNVKRDVFVYDRVAHRTDLVSVSSKNKQGNGESSAARISADGRFVVFQSYSSNFGLKLTNFQIGDFLRDRALNRLEPVSLTNAGELPFGSAYQPTVSADGRLVAFQCQGLTIADPPSGQLAVYVRDRQARTTERASGTASGFGIDDFAGPGSLSRDGGTVAFLSRSAQLAADDTNVATDIFASEMTFPPAAPVPVAHAGPDQNVVATGKKTKVTLDASLSTDPSSSPLKFAWFESGKKIATGAHPKLKLTPGAHSIWLVATDKKKLVGADEVLVVVTP